MRCVCGWWPTPSRLRDGSTSAAESHLISTSDVRAYEGTSIFSSIGVAVQRLDNDEVDYTIRYNHELLI